MDTQGEDSSQDDIQQATAELPEVPVQILHRPRFRETFVGISRASDLEYAGGGQQEQRCRKMSCLWKGEQKAIRVSSKTDFYLTGVSVEAVKSRGP